ncbi:MAG: iron-containing alcohol dehydrogenase, partial [Pseudomonadota bacterium]
MITYLNRVHLGEGILAEALSAELTNLSVTRPFIVTDAGLVSAGLVDRLQDALPDGVTATVFDRTPANPTEAAVTDACQVYASAGSDGMIG